jgi:F-type H+-transporting ATPase subunit b
MNLNLTLIGQAISFAIFVYLCMRFVWPPIINALQERKEKIAAGLVDAEKSKQSLLDARKVADEMLQETKTQVRDIINNAHDEAKVLLAKAKEDASKQASIITKQAEQEVESLIIKGKKDLQNQYANLVMQGVTKILERDVKQADHEEIIKNLAVKL